MEGILNRPDKITILNVEDDLSVQRLTHRVLAQAGHTVFDAQNGPEALRLAQAHHPRLAIVDIHLSEGMDGLALCRMLWENQSIDVFLTTGVLIEDSARVKAYQAGAIRYFKKPLLLQKLLDEVDFYQRGPEPLVKYPQAESRRAAVLHGALLPKILVVNDDEKFLTAAGIHLNDAQYIPYAVRSGYRAIIAACKLKPAAIILDISLPDIGGAEVIRCLKAHPSTQNIPILVWTRSKRQGQEFVCLEEGAEDYLVKGAHELGSLSMRISKILRSVVGAPTQLIQTGPVTLNMSTRNVSVFGQPIMNLAPRELRLLSYLMEQSPRVVSWDSIERNLWGVPLESLTHSYAIESIGVHLRRLRLKLGRAACCLVTHKGVGIQFDPARSIEHVLPALRAS